MPRTGNPVRLLPAGGVTQASGTCVTVDRMEAERSERTDGPAHGRRDACLHNRARGRPRLLKAASPCSFRNSHLLPVSVAAGPAEPVFTRSKAWIWFR